MISTNPQNEQLWAEETELQRLLAGVSADRVIDRMGLEARLEEVRRQLQRPAPRNAERCQEMEVTGVLAGYLPNGRTFELNDETLGLVKGKIAPAVEHPDQLANFLNRRVVLRVRKTVLGSGRPRFALLALPRLAERDADV